MRAPQHRLLAVLLIMPMLAVLLLTSDFPVPPPLEPPAQAPHAVISLGDSTISGEGAGSYEPGTGGENGDWCHRSTRALVHHVAIPGVSTAINLACSGANADLVGLTKNTHYTEGSQTRRLGQLALRYRVDALLVAVGANDDPHFSDAMSRCIQAKVSPNGPDCHTELATQWRDRVNRTTPKVKAALRDIRSTMRGAGYPDTSYTLVLLSYAAPVGPGIPAALQSLAGCPFRTPDLTWVHDTAVQQLSASLHRAATDTGTRFLDLARAGVGHEACTGGQDIGREWFTRLTVDWLSLQNDQRAGHAIQESFHPNDRGHSAFAQCLTEFLPRQDRAGACIPTPDGALHAITTVSAE